MNQLGVEISATTVGSIDGESVIEYEMKSSTTIIRCLNYGVTILSILSGGSNNNTDMQEITLNYRSFDELNVQKDVPYYGCVVGRVANRSV